MGRNNREDDTNAVWYAIWKYDIIGNRFVHIGGIEESRYIMKDLYSNALVAINWDISGVTDAYAHIYYHVSDNRVARNTFLTNLTFPAGTPSYRFYSGEPGWIDIFRGNFRNDIAMTNILWTQAEVGVRGTYEELIVHDRRGFNRLTVTVAVNSWRPHEIVRRPIVFDTASVFNRVWQQPMADLIAARRGPGDTILTEENWWLLNPPGLQDYERFALHDFTGDGVPELLLGRRDMDHFAWDVYRWWNNQLRFIGSFESYSKYLATVRGVHSSGSARAARDLFAFDPVPNEFFTNTVKRISITDNMLQNETLLAVSGQGSSQRYHEGSVYRLTNDTRSTTRHSLASINYNTLQTRLIDYVNEYRQIRTFDIAFVPPEAALIMWVLTNGFTRLSH
jgi:hypothetical protein